MNEERKKTIWSTIIQAIVAVASAVLGIEIIY